MKDKIKRFGDFLAKAINGKRTSLLICILAGAVGALPYFIEQLFICTFISLFLLFYVAIIQRKAHKNVFMPFLCYYIGFYIPLYSFLAELYPYDRFGFSGEQAIFVLICSCLLIPLAHASVGALIMLFSKLLPQNAWSIIGYAALTVIGEWILTLGTLAFPWGGIAVSMTGFLPFLQTASLFGKYFITFITAASCCAFAFALYEKVKIFALIGAITITANALVGTVMWFIPGPTSEPIDTVILQGNVLSNEKWVDGNTQLIFERYVSMSEEAAKGGAKLIILPESAMPQIFIENGGIHNALAGITKEYQCTIVLGARYYDEIDEYNSCLAILPDGTISERYDKRHLVPFGEFIPFADTLGRLLPFVGEFNESSSEFTEGKEPVVIKTEFGDIAPLVCFDSIFPNFSREGVNNGASMIAVVTNDSWFYDSVGVYTHLRHSQIRAIENGRFVLRAANTGISALIDEQGKIISQSEPLVEDTVECHSYAINNKTLYTSIGDIVVYLCFALISVFIIHNVFRRSNGKDSTSQK